MGSRGPKPMPAVVRLITGAPKRVAVDLSDGLHPEVAIPDAPADLTPDAEAEWTRITPLLAELGLLAKIDRAALLLYVRVAGRLEVVERALAAEQTRLTEAGADPAGAMVHTTPTGFSREAVLSRLAGDLGTQLDRYLSAFGLSPATRARVTASRNTGQASLEGFDDSPGRFFTHE